MEQEFIKEKQPLKSKTSRRMRYEAEAVMIQRQLGTLEEIQGRLGVSGHKLCRMLLIDPSAWSRWKKQGAAPPYVYRALQWFSLLEEKYPGLGPQTFLVDTGGAQTRAELQAEIAKRQQLETRFSEELRAAKYEQQGRYDSLLADQAKLQRQLRYLLASLGLLVALVLFLGFKAAGV